MNIAKLIKLRQLRQAKDNKSLIPKPPDTTDPKELLQWIARVSAIAAISPNQIDEQALNTCLSAVKLMMPKHIREFDAVEVLLVSGWVTPEIAEEILNGINDLELRARKAFQSSKDTDSITLKNK